MKLWNLPYFYREILHNIETNLSDDTVVIRFDYFDGLISILYTFNLDFGVLLTD